MTRAEIIDLLRADLRQISCPDCVPDTAFDKLLDAFMLVQSQRDSAIEAYYIAKEMSRVGPRAVEAKDADIRLLLTQPNLEQGRE